LSPSPVSDEITAAVQLMLTGDRAAGRARLEGVWSRISSNPEPVHECVLAHHMADAQDDPIDELAWDLRSLEAVQRCTDADVQREYANGSVAALMPSIHVNLAEDYFKLGDHERSGEHLASARRFVGVLEDDAYGQMLRRGVERMARRLEAAAQASS
jgi:hypothetical protein